MTARRITVGYLFPDLMSADGDRGNVQAIVRRCGWRGIEAAVAELRLGDPVTPGAVDVLVIGGGGEPQQRLVAADLYKVKGGGIRDAVAAGAAALAVGGGFELFGRFCQPPSGAELRGIELFDTWTIWRASGPADRDGPTTGARRERAGDLVVRWAGGMLVGLEHRCGSTYLGSEAQPLGEVLRGRGNNGDGSEGCIVGRAVGTNMHGPCLPANPALTDFLISAALAHRYGSGKLVLLPDGLEQAARDAAIRRSRLRARGRVRTYALPRQITGRDARPAVSSRLGVSGRADVRR
jgi:lipid II isoglutaminyl synthase (glutamine-hydrolysing)